MSIETKIQIINRLEKVETASSLANVFSAGKAIVSDIKSKRDIILKFSLKFDSEVGQKK